MTEAETLKLVFTTNRHLAEWATIAVFVGLLGDILVIFLFSKDKPKAETWLAFLCTLVIAAGVYGEYSFGGKASSAADRLQQISDEAVSSANSAAESAKTISKGFEHDIFLVKKDAAEANERAKKYEAGIAEANARAKSAEAQVASAKEQAVKAELRAVEVQLELLKFKAPRILTPIQRERIKAKLQRFSGTPYELAVVPMPEAMSLVGTMDTILRLSAWTNKESAKTDFRNVFTSSSGSKIELEYLSGFVVKGTGALLVKYSAAVNAFVGALKAEGIDARVELLKDDDPSPGNIHVTVGIKE
jgi:hypothetical protein